jgi:hypothetical protein
MGAHRRAPVKKIGANIKEFVRGDEGGNMVDMVQHDHPIIQKALKRFYKDEIPETIAKSLPLVEEFCKEHLSTQLFANLDVLFIQHHLGPFIPRLRTMFQYGLEPSRCWFVDIPYSTNASVREELKRLGCPEAQMAEPLNDPIAPYSKRQLERVEFILRLYANWARRKRLLVVDDGAYFMRTLNWLIPREKELVLDFKEHPTYIVEQTTRGHRYLEGHKAKGLLERLNLPAISIARTKTKYALESPFIGAAVSRGVKRALKKSGRFKKGLGRVLIIGFGAVGKATACELMSLKTERPIHVYDKKWKELRPMIEQIGAQTLEAFPDKGPYDTILGCTGYASFPLDKVDILSHDAVLVSGSSAAVEFNREKFIDLAYRNDKDDFFVVEPEKSRRLGIHAPLEMQKGDTRFSFLNAGFPVNFDGRMECLPCLVIQITHGLLLAAAKESLNSANRPGFRNLNRKDDQWFKEHGLPWIDRYGKGNVEGLEI